MTDFSSPILAEPNDSGERRAFERLAADFLAGVSTERDRLALYPRLADNPAQTRELVALLQVNTGLKILARMEGRTAGERAGDLLRQVEARLRVDRRLAEKAETRWVERARDGGRRSRPAVSGGRARLRLRVIAPAACAALVAGLLIYAWIQPSRPPGPILAEIEATSAGVVLVRGGGEVPVVAGSEESVRAGDGVRTDGNGAAVARYLNEETAVALRRVTRAVFLRAGDGGQGDSPRQPFGKHVKLECGTLDVTVAPQPGDRPMVLTTPHAAVRVLGTAFVLSVDQRETRLDVRKGRVRFTSRYDRASLVVSPGESVVAREGGSLARRAAEKPRRTWYVRPAGGAYGREDGTDYANAFDGLPNVVWGEQGVGSGDTLYVCGLHVHEVKGGGPVREQVALPVPGGAGPQRATVIRGDHPGDPGFVWGGYRLGHTPWKDEGGGVWSIRLPGDAEPVLFFQDIGRDGPASFVLLERSADLDALRRRPGTQFSATYAAGTSFYVHCSDGARPDGRIHGNRWGYKFRLDSRRHITFKNLNFRALYRLIDEDEHPSHVRWEGCSLLYGEGALVRLRERCSHMAVIDCELGWGGAGVLYRGESLDAPSHFVVRGNYIHDIGVLPGQRSSFSHAIGFDGPRNGLIERNRVENTGTGVVLYAFADQPASNNRVRYNVVRDTHDFGKLSVGITMASVGDAVADKSGNVLHHNIVINCGTGLVVHFGQRQRVHHNVFLNCDVGLLSYRAAAMTGSSAVVTNNIFAGSRQFHVKLGVRAPSTSFHLDYNLYAPATGRRFRLQNSLHTFDEWRRLSREGFTFDKHSQAGDPRFRNASGTFLKAEDFRLLPDSPAINAGSHTRLKHDFLGAPFRGAPDVGAFESRVLNVRPGGDDGF